MKETALMRNVPILVIVTSVLLAAAGCTPAPRTAGALEPAPDSTIHIPRATLVRGDVVVAELRDEPIADTVMVSGEITPRPRDVAHVSTRVAGAVQVARAVVGDHVARGDVLATLFSPEFTAAQGDYLLAHERAEGTPGQAQDSSLAGIAASARQRLRILGAGDADLERLERTHELLEALSLRSPIAGVVTEAEAAAGRQLEAGTDLFGIADLRHVWAVVGVPERDLGRLRVGQSARVLATAYPGEEFPGRVASLEGSVRPDTRTLDARLELANPDLRLKPGMFVTARVATGDTRRALVLPEDAVQPEGDRRLAYVAVGESTFVVRPVTVSPLGAGRVEVVSGLRPGERVAVKGAFLLRSQASKSQIGGE